MTHYLTPSPKEVREKEKQDFLASVGWDKAHIAFLSGDCSFRTYHRLSDKISKRTVLLMDAPAPHEDTAAFERVGKLLEGYGLRAPEILASDHEKGLLLIEDFGDKTFTNCLNRGMNPKPLYDNAVNVLLHLHKSFSTDDTSEEPLNQYDDVALLEEANLFLDWYCPHWIRQELSDAAKQSYQEILLGLFPLARNVPQSLVLRDYHVDNLMVCDDGEDIHKCGLLDFQDALLGPVSYDLVSLLEDARRDVPEQMSLALKKNYIEANPGIDPESFETSYNI